MFRGQEEVASATSLSIGLEKIFDWSWKTDQVDLRQLTTCVSGEEIAQLLPQDLERRRESVMNAR